MLQCPGMQKQRPYLSVVFFDESVFFFDSYRHCKINNICTFATDELIKIFKQEPLNIEENSFFQSFI